MNAATKRYEISLRSVVASDPMSLAASLCLTVAVVVPAIIFIHSRITGIQPKESWPQVAVITAFFVLLVYLFLRYRKERIRRIIDSGVFVRADVLRARVINTWVFIRLVYQWEGSEIGRDLMFVSSGRTRRLTEKEQVTLAVSGGQIVILDIYRLDSAGVERAGGVLGS